MIRTGMDSVPAPCQRALPPGLLPKGRCPLGIPGKGNDFPCTPQLGL